MSLSSAQIQIAVVELERLYPGQSWSISYDESVRAYLITCSRTYRSSNYVGDHQMIGVSDVIRAAAEMVRVSERRLSSDSSTLLANALLRQFFPFSASIAVTLHASGGYNVYIDDLSMIAGQYHCDNDEMLARLIVRLARLALQRPQSIREPEDSLPPASSVTTPRMVTL